MKNIFLIAYFMLASALLFAQNNLSLEDIWLNNKYAAAAPDGFTPLKDGKSYVKLVSINSQLDILQYSYESGAATDTIVKESELKADGMDDPIDPSDFSFSENENKILFATEQEKIYRYSYRADYYVFDRATKKLLPVSANGKQESCVLSPDGSRACFMRDNNLFIADLNSGKETAITTDGERNKIINGVPDWVYQEEFSFTTAFEWAPDGKHIAYYRFDETDVPEYTVQYFTGLYPENYTYKYPKVGENNSKVLIFIYDADAKKATKVNVNDYEYIPRIKWTDDASKLCVFTMNRWQNQLDLFLADASTGAVSKMFSETNKRYIEINDYLTFFNHNKNFLWVSEQNGWMHVYNYTMDGKLVNEITTGNYDVTDFYGYDEAHDLLYYQSAEVSPMERYVYSIHLNGKGKKIITQQKGTNGAEFNPAFSYYMITHSDANTPPDYRLYNSSGKELRVLEDNADLKAELTAMHLPAKEFFQFTTSDGVALNGYMIKPFSASGSDDRTQYPVFQTFYGGPGSQSVLDAWGGGNHLFQEYLAQKGYVIVCVDNRGTGARGEEFRKMTYLQLGHYECIDQIETAKYLSTLPYIDGSRICTFGWSYGGYLSSLCIEKGNHQFKSAVAVAPVVDWRFYDSVYTERYMRDNKENQKGYEDNSPIFFADSIKGHYLIIHGLSDDNVHYQNTATMLKALYQNNIVFDQMTFPDKTHGISGGNTRFYLFSRIADWVMKND